MYFLIYRSVASTNMTEEALKLLLAQSRERNKTLDITGMLVFFDGKFLQLLEGDEKDVKQLYADICRDSRHKQLITLKEGPANQRQFPGWSMSFRTISAEEISNEPAYKDIYKPGSKGAMDLVSLFNRLRGKVEG
ncbi:MAG: BLUF domain-containing protein [Pyrinomonadaceae bacterium]|nr:BLUF domain-containing protein [Sphingobacteriaceae bacterium]